MSNNFDKYHSDGRNWRWGGFYYCKEDKRLVVPRKWRALGWTLNCANKLALPFFILLLLIGYGLIFILKRSGVEHGTSLAIKFAFVVVLGLVCCRMARPK